MFIVLCVFLEIAGEIKPTKKRMLPKKCTLNIRMGREPQLKDMFIN